MKHKLTKTEKAEVIMEALFRGTKVNNTWTYWKQGVKRMRSQPAYFVEGNYQQALKMLNK